MNKLCKLTTLMLSILMACSILIGCNSGGSDTGSSTNTSSGGADTAGTDTGELDTSEEVEIILYVVSDRPARQDEIDANFNELFKEKLNCTLKVNWIGWAEYSNKYPLLFSSGEEFDMAYTATWLNFASLAQKGAFMNLDELWPTYAPENYARQSESALYQATVDGHYYCIPTLLATYSAYGPTYRTDILEGTDWDGAMENFEDYETYLEYVKENSTLEPIDIYQSGSELDDVYMYSNGLYAIKGSTNDFLWIDPAEENPQLFTYYEYDGTGDFLEMMNRWNEKGFFTKSALSDTDSTKMQNSIAASKVHNIDQYQAQNIYLPDAGVQFSNFVSDVSYMSFTQDALVISNTSKNPERALALYELITSDEEAFRAFYYGIEGTSYQIVDNQVEMLNTDEFTTSALWAARTDEFFLDTYGSPDDLNEWKDGFDEYIEEGVGSQKYRSFVLDTSSIETEYAACQNVHQQYWWPLELGYTDAETGLAEYQSKMEAAGIETVRETIQAQLDEYLASLS